MAISSTSTHLRLIVMPSPSMAFGNLIDGVLGNLDYQISIRHHCLTGQPRVGLQTPCLVEHVVFQLVGLFKRRKALPNHHMTSGAGTGLLTGVLNMDAIAQCNIQHGLTGLGLHHRTFWAVLCMWQENYLRHLDHSSISLSCRPANAALTVESRRRAAKASVIWLRRLIWRSMAMPSGLSSSSRKACICTLMASRSSSSSRRSPSTARAASTASSRR